MARAYFVVLSALLTACAVGTTPASTTTVPTTTTSAAPADASSAASMFQACMTEAGFAVEPVPVDGSGRPDLSGLADASSDLAFRQALTECAPLLGSFLSLDDSPGLAAMVRDQLVRYSQCMRASAVEDFPDPAQEFDGTAPPFPPEQIPLEDPDFVTAMEACAAALSLSE